jgi:hypothetical protein
LVPLGHTVAKARLGTRLTSWAIPDDVYGAMKVYFQTDDTANVNWKYQTVCSRLGMDVCGMYDSSEIGIVPHAETWGLRRVKLTVLDITGAAVGATVGLFLVLGTGYGIYACVRRRSIR